MVSSARWSGGRASTQSGPPLPARVLLTPAYAQDTYESSAISQRQSDVHLLAAGQSQPSNKRQCLYDIKQDTYTHV